MGGRTGNRMGRCPERRPESPSGSRGGRTRVTDAPIEPLALLRAAVAIPSPSGDEAEVAGFLVGEMARFCDEAFVDRAGNAVGVWGRGPLAITFLGHIDTVPGEVPVRLEDGRLYGRGTVDAKGPFCAAVCAAAQLPEALRARFTLRLVGAVEEEAPSSRGARHALHAHPPPQLLLIGEPSGWQSLTLGYKGRLVVQLEADKPHFHSAGPGTTAAEDVAEGWVRVRDWSERASVGAAGVFDRVQASLQAIHGDADGLQQRAHATVGLRLPLAWPPDEAERALRAEPLPAGVRLRFGGHEAACRGPRDSPLTRAFRVAIRRAGGRPRTAVKTGTSDWNVVAPHWRVPTLAYGPGDSTLDHTPDEHLEVAELERAVAVLRGALERLGDGDG